MYADIGMAPHDIEAEESCLVAAMVGGPEVVGEMVQILRPPHFFRETSQWIWGAIGDVFRGGGEVNQITVSHQLSQVDRLDDAGGMAFLAKLISSYATDVGWRFYADLVVEKASRRAIMEAAHNVLMAALQGTSLDPQTDVQEPLLRLLRAGEDSQRKRSRDAAELFADVEDLIAFMDAPGKMTGIPTPWPALNRLTGGLAATNLVMVQAATSIGKSLWCQQIALHCMLAGEPVLFATGEMSDREVRNRLVFLRAGINRETGRSRGHFWPEEITDVNYRLGELATTPLVVTEDMRLGSIVAETRRLCAMGRCRILFVDHIQHVQVERTVGMNRTNEMDTITRTLMDLAHREDIVVVAITHQNRQGDARLSGSIEQDANVQITLRAMAPAHTLNRGGGELVELTREELRDWRATHSSVLIECGVLKQRDGRTGIVLMNQDWSRGGGYEELT